MILWRAVNAKKVIFVSGKIYYELFKARNDAKLTNMALVRVEQLYPFPEKQLEKIIGQYTKNHDWVWVQEEPENQGAWSFMAEPVSKPNSIWSLSYIGRDPSSSPATGYHHVFVEEQEKIVREAIYGAQQKTKQRPRQAQQSRARKQADVGHKIEYECELKVDRMNSR